MNDYKDMGVNGFYQPYNAPVTSGTTNVSAYDFQSENERNAVSETQVRSISADKITAGTINSAVIYGGTITGNQLAGGTLTLGGTLNGNGLIQIEDSAGTSILQIDNTGMSLISGTTVVDGSGLVSTTQFSPASVSGASTQTTSSKTYVDITGLTTTFTTSRSQNVLMFGLAASKAADPDNWDIAKINVLIDSTTIGAEVYCSGVTVYKSGIFSLEYGSTFVQEILTLAAGSHTLKMQFLSQDGQDVKVNRASCVVGYVILGK